MSGRSRQSVIIFLVLFEILVVAFVACGCFGGGGDATTTSLGATVLTSKPFETAGEALEGTQLVIPGQQPTAEESIFTSDATPAEVVDALTQGKPMVLLFYVPGAADDVSVLKSLNRLKTSFGQYEFLVYDYKLPNDYGDLSTLLGVGYPPELILVDKTGVVQKVYNGYIDEGTLNQGLVNLGRS